MNWLFLPILSRDNQARSSAAKREKIQKETETGNNSKLHYCPLKPNNKTTVHDRIILIRSDSEVGMC